MRKKKKSKNSGSKLVVTKEVINPVTDEKEMKTQPSPLTLGIHYQDGSYITSSSRRLL